MEKGRCCFSVVFVYGFFILCSYGFPLFNSSFSFRLTDKFQMDFSQQNLLLPNDRRMWRKNGTTCLCIFFSMVLLSHFLFFTLFLSVFFPVQIGSVRFRRTRCVFVCWSVFHSLFVCVYFYSHLCGISWSKWSENQQQLHQQNVQQHTWVFLSSAHARQTKWITRYEREELVNETDGNKRQKIHSFMKSMLMDSMECVCVCQNGYKFIYPSTDRALVCVCVRECVRVCVMPYSYNFEPNTLLFYRQIIHLARPLTVCVDVSLTVHGNITFSIVHHPQIHAHTNVR